MSSYLLVTESCYIFLGSFLGSVLRMAWLSAVEFRYLTVFVDGMPRRFLLSVEREKK